MAQCKKHQNEKTRMEIKKLRIQMKENEKNVRQEAKTRRIWIWRSVNCKQENNAEEKRVAVYGWVLQRRHCSSYRSSKVNSAGVMACSSSQSQRRRCTKCSKGGRARSNQSRREQQKSGTRNGGCKRTVMRAPGARGSQPRVSGCFCF